MQNSPSKTNSLIYWIVCNKLPSSCIFHRKNKSHWTAFKNLSHPSIFVISLWQLSRKPSLFYLLDLWLWWEMAGSNSTVAFLWLQWSRQWEMEDGVGRAFEVRMRPGWWISGMMWTGAGLQLAGLQQGSGQSTWNMGLSGGCRLGLGLEQLEKSSAPGEWVIRGQCQSSNGGRISHWVGESIGGFSGVRGSVAAYLPCSESVSLFR